MDSKKIFETDYLDIAYDGKNKKYGGYELRKKYSVRMLMGGIIAILFVGSIFAATLIRPKEVAVVEELPDLDKTLANIEPPPLKKDAPPPPPPKSPPPPVKPTVKFTPPVIKKNEEVRKEDKVDKEEIKKENIDFGAVKRDGDASANAVSRNDFEGPGGDGKDEIAKVEPPADDNKLYTSVSKKAAFKGDMASYLRSNLKYPPQAMETGLEGTVVVQFEVDKSGRVINPKVLNDPGGGLGKEAIRVINSTNGKWEPAEQNGKQVRSLFSQRVQFKLNK